MFMVLRLTHNCESEAADLIYRYIKARDTLKNAHQIMKVNGIAIPDNLRNVLNVNDDTKLGFQIIRLISFLQIAKDAASQRTLPKEFRVTTDDINRYVKPELQHSLLSRAGFLHR